MTRIINFLNDLLKGFSGLYNEMIKMREIPYFGYTSIISLISIGVVTFVVALILFKIIRLFIGG